jgi:hypothetical protein
MKHWVASLLELCNKNHNAWGGFWYVEAVTALNFAFFSSQQFSESIAFLKTYAGLIRAKTLLQTQEGDKVHAEWQNRHHVAFCGICHKRIWWTCRILALCAAFWGIGVMFTDPTPSKWYALMMAPILGYLVTTFAGAILFTVMCFYMRSAANSKIDPINPEQLEEEFKKTGVKKSTKIIKNNKPPKNGGK